MAASGAAGWAARERFAEGAGVRLHLLDMGPDTGDPVILLPGWPQTAYAWRRVMPLMAEQGWRTLAIDLPGHAESGLMPEGVPYSADNVAEVIHAAVQSMGLGPVHVASHDVGAWVAFSWAALHPEAVRSLALLETQLLGITPAPLPAQAPRAFQYFFNGVPGFAEMMTRGRERDYLEYMFRTKVLVQGAIGPADLDEYMRTYGDPARMRAGFMYYRAVPANMEAHAKAPKLPMPVLALGGAGGVGTALHDALRGRATDLRGGELDGCGHYMPEECPAELTSRLVAFLGEAGAGVPAT